MIRKRGQILLVLLALGIALGLFYLNRSVKEWSQVSGEPALAVPAGESISAVTESGTSGLVSGESASTDPKVAQPGVADEFERLLSNTLNQLPAISELSELGEEEVHHSPAILDRAGDLLGAVAEQLKSHPELAPRAARFYEDCALREGLLTPVRALCLASSDALPRKFPDLKFTPIDRRRLPEEIWDLAGKVSPQ